MPASTGSPLSPRWRSGSGPDHAAANHRRCAVHARHGPARVPCPQRAARYFGLAARLAPSKPDYLVAAAVAAFRSGDRDRAARYCERAAALDPQFEPAHRLLFDMFLHGEPHHDLLARIHRHLKPRTYVEIGVENGVSFTLALPDTLALGVDPEPAITYPMPAKGRVFAETSDAFFSRDVRAELGGLPVDLAFIDGMHHFELALRDFVNLERLCAPGSTILIHDCFPHDRRTRSASGRSASGRGTSGS